MTGILPMARLLTTTLLHFSRRIGSRFSGGMLRCVLIGLAVALLTGCASSRQGTTSGNAAPNSPIDRIHIISQPVAINFDQLPGADGFGVTLFATTAREPKSVAIPEGKLEILMYDGLLKVREFATTKPLKTWTYTAEELRAYAANGSIGVGYRLTPQWGDQVPTQNRITVLARYTSPTGAVRYSEPTVISLLAG